MWTPAIQNRNIYLVRHGESEQNAAINANDTCDTPDHAAVLTEAGREQARKAGEFLASVIKDPTKTIMYNSPYMRTRETAQEIQKHLAPKKSLEDDMLVELSFGSFDGIPKSQVPSMYPREWTEYQRLRQFNGKFFARRPGGETPLECEVRQKLFLQTLASDLLDLSIENIIIVGHGAQLTCLRKAMFRYTHEWYEREPNPGNCSIQLVKYDMAPVKDEGYVYGSTDKKKQG